MDGRLVKVGLEKPISSFHFIEYWLGYALLNEIYPKTKFVFNLFPINQLILHTW